MKNKSYDFSGWATKNNIKCSDGRTIRRNAFKECDGLSVPLVYNHDHNNINNVIGHAVLENRDDGVYAYGYLNQTTEGKNAKLMLENGDITNMSIYANKLQHAGKDVIHGIIREVSLVLAGANPGAKIEYVMSHGDDMFEEEPTECDIWTDEQIVLAHSEDSDVSEEDDDENDENDVIEEDNIEHSDDNSKSDNNSKKEDEGMADDNKNFDPKKIYEAMTDEQKEAVTIIVGAAAEAAVEEAIKNNNTEDENVKHNVFEGEERIENTLSHSDFAEIRADGERCGSLKEAALQHGITDIDILFPDAKNITTEPTWIKRDTTWVQQVLGACHHSPISRIKMIHADIREDEARALGYFKGNLKKEEVFSLLKRKIDPQTIYKLQAFDRDDIIDITDFNVVAWVKAEMRVMLDEELARAILIGDGRSAASDDKIKEQHITPVWNDAELYTITKTVVNNANKAKKFIETCIRARKEYKGSGNPDLYTTEDMLTDMLLLEDGIGRPLYDTMDKLKTKLRVRDIITVPVAENVTKTVDGVEHTFGGLIVNLTDYTIGADKGGSVSLFDDFDIQYNKERYLIETRCSGILTKPFSAIAIDIVEPTGNETPSEPDNNEVTEG